MEKVIAFQSVDKYNHCLHVETVQNKYAGGFWWKLCAVIESLWIIDLYFSNSFKLKYLNEGFVSCKCAYFWFKTLNDEQQSCFGLLECLYLLFGLSFWRHPFTAEDPLVSKWYKAKFPQICSDEEKNSSTSWMAWERVNFQQIKIFRVNYSLNAGRWGPLKHIRPYYFFSNNLIIISWQEENNTDKDLFVRAEINEFHHPFTKHFQTFKYWAASNEMDHSEETMTLKSNNSKAKSF